MDNKKHPGKSSSKSKTRKTKRHETLLGNVSVISGEEDVPTREYVLVSCRVKSNKPKKCEISTQTECQWPPPKKETKQTEEVEEPLDVEDEIEKPEKEGEEKEQENLEPEQPAEESVEGKEVEDDSQLAEAE